MIYFEYRRADGSILASNFPNGFVDPFSGNEQSDSKSKHARNLFKTTDYGSVRILITEETDYLNLSLIHI